MSTENPPTDRLSVTAEAGGQRHTLAGRPVHAGDTLELQLLDGWVRGRYEWAFDARPPALLIRLAGTEEPATLRLPAAALLRWPE